jgi:alkylation response protein AidB-like acyl-CoA dehydrogenase
MKFEWSEEQELLRKTVRNFLNVHAPMKAVRETLDAGDLYASDLWQRMAELGWMGLAIPERYGGSGLGPVELSIVAEELGRSLAPVPFIPTQAAARAVWEAGDEPQRAQWLAAISSGEAIGTLAIDEPHRAADDLQLGVIAVRDAQGWALTGSKWFVPDAGAADLLVTTARPDSESAATLMFAVPAYTRGMSIEPMVSMDPLRKLSVVRFDSARLPESALLGGNLDAAEPLRKTLDFARVAICAEMVGGAEVCLEASVAHASQREQFGRPIGSYQAIKHKCADMLFEVESARSITCYAAWAIDANRDDPSLRVAMAKAYVSDAYRHVSAENIQIHGGVGFTWETDCHLFFKRAKSDEMWLGDGAYHRERVAQLLAL